MPSDILARIVADKKAEVAAAQKRMPEARLRERAEAIAGRRPFFRSLETPGPSGVNIIAEIKRASPSKGIIRADIDPAAQATAYEKGGAAALSVLTDGPHFHGSFDDLRAARSAVSLPVLRKDFVISTYQLHETAALPADAALLIVRILSAAQLAEYLAVCREIGLDALVEVHSEAELDTAVAAGATLIGINNRNLRSFETSIDTAVRMAGQVPGGRVPVAESGIGSREDIVRLREAGIHNFLIGESLVRADDPEAFLKRLMGVSP